MNHFLMALTCLIFLPVPTAFAEKEDTAPLVGTLHREEREATRRFEREYARVDFGRVGRLDIAGCGRSAMVHEPAAASRSPHPQEPASKADHMDQGLDSGDPLR